MKSKLGVFDISSSLPLHKLKFYSYMDLYLEIKRDKEEFEEYNEDWLYLRTLKYVEDS